MNNPEPIHEEDDIRPEYGHEVFERGVRGKYFNRFQEGTNVVLIPPDVRVAFPTNESVNEALRLLLRLAQQSIKTPAG